MDEHTRRRQTVRSALLSRLSQGLKEPTYFGLNQRITVKSRLYTHPSIIRTPTSQLWHSGKCCNPMYNTHLVSYSCDDD